MAVLAVIAYHFDIPGAAGGFVGVDVFFVISGFFITRLLIHEIDREGRLDLLQFWVNRAKRLLPNGLLVILVVLGLSFALLPAYRSLLVSGDALAAASVFANFHFEQRNTDYFQFDAPPSPLLHYWSLAVEEQFYFVLPLLIGGALLLTRSKFSARFVVGVLLAVIIVVSLAAALVEIERNQPAAFFLPQYRASQLALGGLVGLVFDYRSRVPQLLRVLGCAAGCLAVAGSIAFLDDADRYPGALALFPSLGSAALIFGLDAGRRTDISKLLALPPLVLVGDLSYSLYLWHWPVVVFLEALLPNHGLLAAGFGIGVAFLFAALAYYFVERPIHALKLGKQAFPRGIGLAAASIGCVAIVAASAKYLPERVSPETMKEILAAMRDGGENYKIGCHLDLETTIQPECRFGHLGGPRVVLFGDSHAAQWFAPVARAAGDQGWELNAWTKSSCPAADVEVWLIPMRSPYRTCSTWRESIMRSLVEDPPRLVILGNSSRYYGGIYDPEHDGPADRATAESKWLSGMNATIERLIELGVQVVELRDTPHLARDFRDCLKGGDWKDCNTAREVALAGMSGGRSSSERYSQLDFTDQLCGGAFCYSVVDGMIAYRDSNHLASRFAATMHVTFAQLLKSASREDAAVQAVGSAGR